MAELNLRSFQGTDSPILSNKAVQKEYDTPDDVSEEFDAKNELFNATGKLIGTAAKIAGHIEKDRQNSVVEYIKEQMNKQTLNNDTLLNTELQNIPPSEISIEKSLTEFNKEGIKMPNGEMISLRKVSEYEGFESLSKANQTMLKAYESQARESNQRSIFDATKDISYKYTHQQLLKYTGDITNQVGQILGDPKNTEITEIPPAYILENMSLPLDPNIRNGTDYLNHMTDLVRKGNPHVPGAGIGGSKPEDIKKNLGLTRDAKKQLRTLLDKHSDKVFQTVETTPMTMVEAEHIINGIMEDVLYDMASQEFQTNPELAINKVNNNEYTITREFDGEGGLNTVKYVLSPGKTRELRTKYYNSLSTKPKFDPIKIKDDMDRIKNMITNDHPFDPKSYRTYLLNKYPNHPKKVVELEVYAENLMESKKKGEIDTDYADIKSELRHKISQNVNLVEDVLEKVTDKNGVEKLNSIGEPIYRVKDKNKMHGLIEDKKINEFVMQYEDTPYQGRGLVQETKIIPANERSGLNKLTDNDILGIVGPHIESTTKGRRKIWENLVQSNFTTVKDTRKWLLEFTNESNPNELDRDAFTNEWYGNKAMRDAYNNDPTQAMAFFQAQVNYAKSSLEKESKVPLRLVPGDANNEAFISALRKNQDLVHNQYQNYLLGKEGNEEYDFGLDIDHVATLEKKMKEHGYELSEAQRNFAELARSNNKELMARARGYKTWNVNQLSTEVGIMNNTKMTSKTPGFWINANLNTVINKQITERLASLQKDKIGETIFNEISSGDNHWVAQFPHLKNNRHALVHAISQKLQFKEKEGETLLGLVVAYETEMGFETKEKK